MTRRVAYLHSRQLLHAADQLPANEGRASLVHHLISALGLLQDTNGDNPQDEQARARIVQPREAIKDELCRFHDPKYVDTLLGQETDAADSSGSEESDDSAVSPYEPTYGLSRLASSSAPPRKRQKTSTSTSLGLQDDCPLFLSLALYSTLVAGASMTAARLLRDGEADIAISWAGGRHHAKRGEASGFCYVNDIVLAIMELKRAPRSPPPPPASSDHPSPPASPPWPPPPPQTMAKRFSRILYLDLDLHHGDGVESAFFTTPSVLTLSIHLHAPLFFPASGALFSTGPTNSKALGALHALNVALEPGCAGETLERVWKSCVETVVEAYEPDAVVLQCGVDGLAGDPCKEWNLSLSALGSCVSRALSWNKPTLLLGGGGYDSPNAARAWAYLTSIALNRPLPLSTPIPASLPNPLYATFAPSFQLDVPSSLSSIRDKNTDLSLRRVEAAFEGFCEGLWGRYEGKKKGKKQKKKEEEEEQEERGKVPTVGRAKGTAGV
ncbi:hypothetical protein JCM11641_005748 [Rhodosporidiobolus odoratus]